MLRPIDFLSLLSPSLGRAVLSLLSSSRFFFFWWGGTGGGNSERPEGKQEIQHNYFFLKIIIWRSFYFRLKAILCVQIFAREIQKKKNQMFGYFFI